MAELLSGITLYDVWIGIYFVLTFLGSGYLTKMLLIVAPNAIAKRDLWDDFFNSSFFDGFMGSMVSIIVIFIAFIVFMFFAACFFWLGYKLNLIFPF
jgi:hypothetical protein